LGTRSVNACNEIKFPFVIAGRSWLTFRLRGTLLPRSFDPPQAEVSGIDESVFDEGHDVAFALAMPLREPLPRWSVTGHTVRYVTTQYRRHYIDLRNDVPACFERRSSETRRTLRRRIRHFEEVCGAQPIFREYKLQSEMPEFYALARNVAQHTGRSYKGLPRHASFPEELVEMAERDAVRGFILFHGETPVAFNLCRAIGDCLTGDKCAHDEGYSKWSPGAVLRYCLVNRLAEEGKFRLLDLGPGDASYKESMATGSRLFANVFYFRRKPRYLTILWSHWAFSATTRGLVKSLDALHIRERLKTMLLPRPRVEAHVESA
jgi:CelD/BcsL family acetyltransferase involved in cellulose biosynthesis